MKNLDQEEVPLASSHVEPELPVEKPAIPTPLAPQRTVSAPMMPLAEKMLTEKTVVIASPPESGTPATSKPIMPASTQPQSYKTDPYREPIG